MPKDYSRTQRIGDSLQQELARLLQFTLSDPRLKMVSVTGVDVSRDMEALIRDVRAADIELGADSDSTEEQ